MGRKKILWCTVFVCSLSLLIGFSVWGYNFAKNTNFSSYGQGNYYGGGMMNRRISSYNNQQDYSNKQKISIDQIKSAVESYIQGYNNNLEISDIFVFKDTDYYVSVVEKDTGKGAMELLVNPYTGYVYPENGPNMAWNEKYGIQGRRGYGMMSGSRWNGNNRYYQGNNSSKQIDKKEAVKNADAYVKSNIDKNFSVLDKGHEFYGYYTFNVSQGDKPVGLVSVNYYTGDVWYHNWDDQLDKIISQNEK